MDWQSVAAAAYALLLAIFGFWLKQQRDEYKDLQKQVSGLKETAIPRVELHREVDNLRTEVNTRHVENKAAWERIEGKIDHYEAGNARLRHELSDSLHRVALKVAVIATKLGVPNKEGDDT